MNRTTAVRGRARGRPDANAAGTAVLRLVPLLWLGLFFVVPLGFTVVYSFAHSEFGGATLGFTTDNFRRALTDFNLTIFRRTLQFVATGTALCIVVAMPLAYFLARKAGRFRAIFLVLVLIPFCTSFLIRTLAWRTLLADGGPIADVLSFLRLSDGQLGWLDAPPAVFIGLVYGYLPLMTLPLYVAFSRIPTEVLEASRDLGAGGLRTFLNVTLPLARPGIAAGVLLTAVPMTGEFVIPGLLGGQKGLLMGGLISSQYLEAQDLPLGSAMAVLILLVLGIMVVALTRATRGFEATEQQ